MVADNCQRVFIHGLKILWSLENKAAILSWVGGLTQAFQPPKPSPSRQYTQRKILEKKQAIKEAEMSNDGALNSSPSASQSSDPPQQTKSSDPPSSSGPSKSEPTSSSETGTFITRSLLKLVVYTDPRNKLKRHILVTLFKIQHCTKHLQTFEAALIVFLL